MSIEIKVPVLPESVNDATLAKWYKKPGEAISRDENLVDLETDKVMLEVPAPASGAIEKVLVEEGATVVEGQLLAIITEGAAGVTTAPSTKETPETSTAAEPSLAKQAPVAGGASTKSETTSTESTADLLAELSPAVRRLIAEKNVDISQVKGSGRGGRIMKSDVEQFLDSQQGGEASTEKSAGSVNEPIKASMAISQGVTTGRGERRVPMSRLRARIAERLVEVQRDAAILTTFNEIDMKPVMDLRKRYKDQFEKQYDIRLGFMSFFTKAAVEALKRFPSVNASIDGGDIIYHDYYDIGIAVSSPRGLVVPIVRNADMLSMADIEQAIKDYAVKAKNGKLTMEEMTGGTFTITNGGVFGSMLSTPIINPPQTGILGMHNIVQRPVVVNGEIVVRPVMYVALSYDHRVIDGRESVSFLKTIKEMVEDPARVLLSV